MDKFITKYINGLVIYYALKKDKSCPKWTGSHLHVVKY